MPLYVFACRQCGTTVEKLTNSTTSPVPNMISNTCPSCKVKRVFDRQPTSAAVRTDKNHSSVTDSARSSQRTSQEKAARANNIRRGLTGDGRMPTNLKEKSAQAWGGALANANPMPLAEAQKQIDEAKRSS